jgi:hypothetical protein
MTSPRSIQKYLRSLLEAGLEVEQVQPELAPKLTGMLLQLGDDECWACPLDALDPAPPAPWGLMKAVDPPVASKVARWENMGNPRTK